MKKNLFYYLFAVICSVSVFTSCSDDDDDKIVNPVPQTVFNSENGLQLTYNGEPMLGKKVTFTPDATNATKATLRLEGEFDLSGILGNRAVDATPTAPGVFPGTTVTTLPVELSINGDQCTFSGSSETDYCTYSYEGKVTTGALQLAFTDVKLKNAALAGSKWNLVALNDDYTQEPLHIVWESGSKVDIIPGLISMPISDILKLALRLPLLDDGTEDKASVEAMLNTVLKDVTFGADGNIVATYMDVANGGTEWVESPANIAQYVISSNNQLKLFLNPQAIIAAAVRSAKSSKAIDINTVLQQAIGTLYPMLVEGVPLAYSQDGENMKVYLNTELLLPLLKGIVAPLFQDEDFVNMLVEAMKQDPDFGSMAAMATPMLKALPDIIDKTTQVEVGLNLTQAK